MNTLTPYRLRNRLMDWTRPLVMGIINITPDSFYISSEDVSKNVSTAYKMIEEGVDILDLGAMSSRPGADIITVAEEWNRLEPTLKEIRKTFPNTFISVDTLRSEIAERSIMAGADMINDISFGEFDSRMMEVLSGSEIPYIGMHMRGLPHAMQLDIQYDNLIDEIFQYFQDKLIFCDKHKIECILDIGIGFGKSIFQNFELINKLNIFKSLDRPLLVGVSRKSFLYKTLGSTPHDVLHATSAVHLQLLFNGANILRVHDVREAKEIISIYELMQNKLIQ